MEGRLWDCQFAVNLEHFHFKADIFLLLSKEGRQLQDGWYCILVGNPFLLSRYFCANKQCL